MSSSLSENYDGIFEGDVKHIAAKKKKVRDEFIINVIDDQMCITDPEEEQALWIRQSIYKLHNFIKCRNENIYEPLLVSIGPYHHGNDQLKAMEVHKRRAMCHFTKRSGVPIQDYKNALMEDVQILKESYDQLDEIYCKDSNKFVELMMVDGCFILEFMDILSGAPKDYAPNDPIFSYYGCITHYNCLMRDMLLLENQLPYLVLEKLVSVSEFRHQVNKEMMMFASNKDPGRHMLDMYMKGLFQGGPSSESEEIINLSASQLDLVQIRFRKADSFSNISYDVKEATLRIPHININDYSISTFMNLKAFELRGTIGRDFNSYIRLMDSLIESPKDVKLLQSKGIIENCLGSDDAVVKLLKDLARDTVVDKNCKSYVARQKITEHYKEIMRRRDQNNKQWDKRLKRRVGEWLLNLQETYFSNPWSIISVVAAACLLGLTVIQSVYAVRSFDKGQK
ncbi:hypothetical protein IFM89_000042 [Coptis chinensis]|uniref:Uncharacterized protein n=1 Tax=Coptis chinensis TaxID=261450 RepID=A0A835IHW1_9MAGN|nr:hypothetical protein IFM89_000042 [Coptis chinensis]